MRVEDYQADHLKSGPSLINGRTRPEPIEPMIDTFFDWTKLHIGLQHIA